MRKYKIILTELIKELYKHELGRKCKFQTEFYLDYIFRILFYGECWNTFYCPECDRSTIRKKFYKWRDMGIFKCVYSKLIKEYNSNRAFKNFFVDSTIIENSNGCELVDHYYKIKTKKQLKVSVLCDSNRVIVSHLITTPTIHDSQVTGELIKNMKVNMKNNSRVIGDKGYISNKINYRINNKKVTLIFPFRKNQKKRNNKQQIILLKKRFVVEQLFSTLKRTYRRLKLLTERELVNFECFLIMAFSCQIIKCL